MCIGCIIMGLVAFKAYEGGLGSDIDISLISILFSGMKYVDK